MDRYTIRAVVRVACSYPFVAPDAQCPLIGPTTSPKNMSCNPFAPIFADFTARQM